MENKINAFEMWLFRKVANVKWSDRSNNEDVYLKLNLERSLLETIKRRKLSYFGHIKRHHSIKILEGKVKITASVMSCQGIKVFVCSDLVKQLRF